MQLEKKILYCSDLRASEVIEYYKNRSYNPYDIYNNDQRVNTILNQLVNGFLETPKMEFMGLYDSLLSHNDEYFVLKRF